MNASNSSSNCLSKALKDFVEVVVLRSSANLDKVRKLIKFYGHSLGEADYSYFQMIFDGVKLWDNKGVELIFYYSHNSVSKLEYPEESERQERAKDDVMKKAFRLLSLYGRTMLNREKGKNLIHKLMMEDRSKFISCLFSWL